jgi:hypothetical protein
MDKKVVATLLKLRIPSSKLKKDYVARYIGGLKDRISNGVIVKKKDGSIDKSYILSNAAKDILLPKNSDERILKRLLNSEPVVLKKLNDSLTNQLNAIPNVADIPSKYLLLKIFGYEKVFNTSSKSEAYWLSKQIDSNTCVYCNRQYAFTIEKDNGQNKDERIARPVFDHWFDKKDYPLMSLSLCNLIPSCTICNGSVKGTTKFDLATHIHPYVHEAGHPDITFRASLTTGTPPKWTVAIDTPKGSKEEKTINDMKLQEIYAMHGELEVRDLMNFKDAYPTGYLKQLFENVLKDSKCQLNRSEVYCMLFGTEMDSSHFLDRPLSKLKHDILVAIGVLDK